MEGKAVYLLSSHARTIGAASPQQRRTLFSNCVPPTIGVHAIDLIWTIAAYRTPFNAGIVRAAVEVDSASAIIRSVVVDKA